MEESEYKVIKLPKVEAWGGQKPFEAGVRRRDNQAGRRKLGKAGRGKTRGLLPGEKLKSREAKVLVTFGEQEQGPNTVRFSSWEHKSNREQRKANYQRRKKNR